MTHTTQTCARCASPTSQDRAIEINGETVCRRCLHDAAQPLVMYPIGYVRSDLRRPQTGCGTTGERGVSRVELLDSMREFMLGLEDERYLTIVFALHEARGVRTRFNRGLDGKEVGIFASRSPDRLNPIAITEVELVKVEGTTLHVRGLDAIDGSPVLDVKLGRKALRPRA